MQEFTYMFIVVLHDEVSSDLNATGQRLSSDKVTSLAFKVFQLRGMVIFLFQDQAKIVSVKNKTMMLDADNCRL